MILRRLSMITLLHSDAPAGQKQQRCRRIGDFAALPSLQTLPAAETLAWQGR